jgi:predicted DNA-binding protein with PD1-like motif
MLQGQTGKICFARILEGEDLAEAVKKRIEESNVRAGMFMLIGSLKDAVLGYYRDGKYDYVRLEGPLEIASCMGNVAVDEKDDTVIHAHVVLSNEKCEAFGGHLAKGSHVGATAELVIIEGLNVNLVRSPDEKTRLNLLRLS